MIKFSGEREGKPLYGFGLSEGNLKQLRQGKPIFINLEEMGGEGQVLILYGRTEKEIIVDLEGAGLIHPDLEILKHFDEPE